MPPSQSSIALPEAHVRGGSRKMVRLYDRINEKIIRRPSRLLGLLFVPRCRVCLSCQNASRRARNQRYQKSLKDRPVRRVQPRFTREGMSTVTRNHITRQPRQTVDSEGVLLAKAIAS
jgi:hypothetical protein